MGVPGTLLKKNVFSRWRWYNSTWILHGHCRGTNETQKKRFSSFPLFSKRYILKKPCRQQYRWIPWLTPYKGQGAFTGYESMSKMDHWNGSINWLKVVKKTFFCEKNVFFSFCKSSISFKNTSHGVVPRARCASNNQLSCVWRHIVLNMNG